MAKYELANSELTVARRHGAPVGRRFAGLAILIVLVAEALLVAQGRAADFTVIDGQIAGP